MKLTPNFSLEEFIKVTPTDYQRYLLTLLAKNLQIVRDKLQPFALNKSKAVSMSITSGVRTQDDYNRLVKQGYNPSKKSDHFCGVQLDGNVTLGAADVIVNNCSLSLKDCVKKIIEWDKTNQVNFGQVIYEYNPATKKDWIHLGNDWNEVFKDSSFVSRKKYLMSLDNGKTYVDFK